LRTVAGQDVEAIHRGNWSHGLGPDFTDAMVVFDGRELRSGAIEIHLRTRGWTDHGHHLDPHYNQVILHLVARHDGSEPRRADGGLTPVVDLAACGWSPDTTSDDEPVDWSRFGGAVCAATLAASDPAPLREALWRLGDLRLAGRAARLEAELTHLPPGELLYREWLEALGYSANREPMRLLAERLPLTAIEARLRLVASSDRLALANGLLFGAAGFLPMAPADAAAAQIAGDDLAATERMWAAHGAPWHAETLAPTQWVKRRVRPANHPVARLAAAATTMTGAFAAGGLLAAMFEPVRAGRDPIAALRLLAGHRLGADRAGTIAINVLAPMALAVGAHAGDAALIDAAGAAWERLPGVETNERTRRALRQVAGGVRISGLGARGGQGLIHLDAALCAPRRCYECPIARAVIAAGAAGGANESTSGDC
ncbi:MAG TPA: DUF2851 family protein, partial [Thermomicrobiales bacterium]|nr:DUF2851 family protein [Thermomicrobiales bacterium]